MIGRLLSVNIFRKNAVERNRLHTAAAFLRMRALALVREKMFQTTEKIRAKSTFPALDPVEGRASQEVPQKIPGSDLRRLRRNIRSVE